MDTYLDLYIEELESQKQKSKNTIDAYRRDIREFHRFLKENQVTRVENITPADVQAFVERLRSEGRSGSTLNRKMASLRSYGAFLSRERVVESNPAADIRPPKVERKDVEYLSPAEVDAILAAPDDSPKGLRDRAILEMMYGTGIRATEVTELKQEDINLRIGFITCSGEFGKARIIPLGKPCRFALEEYLEKSRPVLMNVRKSTALRCDRDGEPGTEAGAEAAEAIPEDRPVGTEQDSGTAAAIPEPAEDEGCLFVNYHGEKLTRQGLWKIVRTYAAKAGVDRPLTPQILRNSFAVHMLQNGADLKSIQELMGYEDLTTAQIFLSATKNRIKEVFDRTHPRA